MAASVAIANHQASVKFSAPALRRLAARFMAEAVQRDATLAGCTLSVVLVDDRGIIPLNRNFVRHEGATDVISFRYDRLPGAPHGTAEVVVNAERAVQEAKRRGIPVARELALYLAHGCLHLTGEDDATPAQRARMQRIQNRWLKQAATQRLLPTLSPAADLTKPRTKPAAHR